MSTETLAVGKGDLSTFAALFVRRPGETMVCGSKVYDGSEDRRSLYKPGGIGVDMLSGNGVDIVHNLEYPPPWNLRGSFDHVDCVSVIEHSKRPWLLAAGVEECMRTGATILLSAPFVWRIHAYPSDYFRFTPEGIRTLFPGIKWKRLRLSHHALEEDVGEKRETQAPARMIDDSLWMARTEVWGFGVRV